MARKKNTDQGDELAMDLSPMIDCVFLLLIFFIVVSTQSEVKTDPRVTPTIASHSSIQTDSIARIVVNLFKDEESGAITYSDEDAVNLADAELKGYMETQVRSIKENRPDFPATLHLRIFKSFKP